MNASQTGNDENSPFSIVTPLTLGLRSERAADRNLRIRRRNSPGTHEFQFGVKSGHMY